MIYIKCTGHDGVPYQLQIRPEIIEGHTIINGSLVLRCKPSGTHKTKSKDLNWTWTSRITNIQNWTEVKAYLEKIEADGDQAPAKNEASQTKLF